METYSPEQAYKFSILSSNFPVPCRLKENEARICFFMLELLLTNQAEAQSPSVPLGSGTLLPWDISSLRI